MHAFSQSFADFRQLAGSKNNKTDNQDEKQFRNSNTKHEKPPL